MREFSPFSLTLAREYRGQSRTDLSNSVGISAQSISNYEAGKQVPRLQVVLDISKELDFPSSFFFKKIEPRVHNNVFFRSFASAKKSSRNAATYKLRIIEHILTFIDNYIVTDDNCLPSFDFGNKVAELNNAKIESIAQDARMHFNIKKGPIESMAHLLERAGCILICDNTGDVKIDAHSTWSLKTKTPIIIYSQGKSSSRTRLTLAHELCHLILHKSVNANKDNIKKLETQANAFAAAFLMPKDEYIDDVKRVSKGKIRIQHFLQLKEKWGVSIAAQILRCYNTGIIDNSQYTNLYISLSRNNWRTDEPLDDKYLEYKPKFLKKCFEYIANEVFLTKSEILASISLPRADVESLCGLEPGWLEHYPEVEMKFSRRKTSI